MRIEDFCKNNGLEFEVIDLGTLSFLTKLKLKMKGLKTLAVGCGEKMSTAILERRISRSF